MGSSAGAGSGEFHVYRHLRRKEYARQKFIQEKGHKVGNFFHVKYKKILVLFNTYSSLYRNFLMKNITENWRKTKSCPMNLLPKSELSD